MMQKTQKTSIFETQGTISQGDRLRLLHNFPKWGGLIELFNSPKCYITLSTHHAK